MICPLGIGPHFGGCLVRGFTVVRVEIFFIVETHDIDEAVTCSNHHPKY